MTTLMIVMIIVGLALALAGLAYAAWAGLRLYRTGRKMQKAVEAEVAVIVSKQEQLLERAASIEQNQEVLAERIEKMKRATDKLGFVLRQWSEARGRLTRVP